MPSGSADGAPGLERVDSGSAGARSPSAEASSPLLGEDAPLSARVKACFALGALPNALSVTTTGFFLNPFLLEVSGITADLVSMLMLIGRAWDAITTALVGALVARFGSRLRPWLLTWLAPTSAAYFFLWLVVGGSTSTKTTFAFGMYLAYQLFSSMYQVPYTALTVRLHHDAGQRDQATTWRMLTEILSVLIGAGGQSVVLAMYDANNECRSCDFPDASSDASKAYLISAAIMMAIFTVGGLACFFGVVENPPSRAPASAGSESTAVRTGSGEGIRAAFSSRSFVCLTFAYFFIWLTVQGVQGNIMLYCKHSVPAYKDKFQFLLGTLVLCATLGMPCWLVIMRKIGKRNSYICGGLLFAPLLHLLYWLPKDAPLWAGLLICGVSGFALAATYLLPWSMIPNVVDEVELRTGQRYEAVFYAFFVFFMKMGAGIALAVSALVLSKAGWVNNPCCTRLHEDIPCSCGDRDATCDCDVQPDGVGDALRVMIGIAGPALILVGVCLACFYPLNTAKEMEVQEGLIARRIETGKLDADSAPTTEVSASYRFSVASFPDAPALSSRRRTVSSAGGLRTCTSNLSLPLDADARP